MAEIQIQPLTQRLCDEEIEELAAALEGVGAPRLPKTTEGAELVVADEVDRDALDDFLDRLDALDAACEIYLPIEFEGRVGVGDLLVGSTQQLLAALAELKDELGLDEETDDDDDDAFEEEEEAIDAKLRNIWKLLHDGAVEALDRQLPLHVVS